MNEKIKKFGRDFIGYFELPEYVGCLKKDEYRIQPLAY